MVTTPVLHELLEIYPSLPPAERRVADVVIAGPRAVLGLTSSEIASQAAASQPATSRLCSRLQTRTFTAFKVRLAQELGVDDDPRLTYDSANGASDDRPRRHPDPTVTPDPLLADIIEQSEAELATALRSVTALDVAALRGAARHLRTATNVVVCGFDLSGSVAWRLASLLYRAGIRARSERDPHDTPWLDDLGAGDVLVVISYRGQIPQFLGTVRRAQARGTTIVVLTNEAQTELAVAADTLLLTRAPAASTTNDYVTGAALYVQLAAARALWMAVLAEPVVSQPRDEVTDRAAP